MKKGKILLIISLISIIFLTEKTQALTLTSEVTKSGDGFFTLTNASDYTSAYSGYWKRVYDNTNVQSFDFNFSSALNTSDSDYVGFLFQYNQPLGTEVQETNHGRYCTKWHLTEWTSRNNGEFGTMDTYTCQTYSTYDSGTDTYIEQQSVESANFYFRVYYENDGGWNSCFLNDTELVCPTSRKKIEKLQVQVLFKAQHATSFNFAVQRGWNKYKSTTQEMIEKQTETNNTLQQDHTYNNNASQSTTTQENQMNSFEQEEDTLRNSLNLDIEDSEITINPNASNFIWETINRLRQMSGKIVLLFTSVLSLGIMKMILGR